MAVTSEGRVALYLQDKHPIREGMGYVRLAEQQGFEAVWQAESRLVREATVPMAAFAAVTERIAVGSGVVNSVGTGGAATKVSAARLASAAGVGVLVTSAARVSDALGGAAVGTWFEPDPRATASTPTGPVRTAATGAALPARAADAPADGVQRVDTLG